MSQTELKKRKQKVLDNAGSALITVMVFVAFMTVLATILLYISGVNFQIKQNDYRNKKNFYSGETALEEIRAHLMDDVSQAATKAYTRTLARYAELGGESSRTLWYNKYFAEELQKVWGYGAAGGGVPDWKNKLTGYVSSDTVNLAGRDFKLELVKTNPAGDEVERTDAEVLNVDSAEDGYVIIEGVKITFINADGFATIISTDFVVRAPEMEWNGSLDAMGNITVKDNDGNDVERSLDDDSSKVYYAKVDDTVNIAKSVDYINWVKR